MSPHPFLKTAIYVNYHFILNIEMCDHCASAMKIIACIQESTAIKQWARNGMSTYLLPQEATMGISG